MKSKIHILCPEYVPLENKGEEAIIRGVIDVLFADIDCEYHIVDNKSKIYYKKGNIHVHPGSLFFSDWRSREFGLGPSWNQIYSSVCSLLRNGLNKFFPWWILKPHKEARILKQYISGEKQIPSKYKKSVSLLKKVNYIIAGHNGGLNEYVCHILNELNSINISFGIFGSSFNPNVKQKTMLKIFEKTFCYSDFNIARNHIGYNWALKNFPHLTFELKPDPAFGMIPENDSVINEIIEQNGLFGLFNKPVVMITTAEPAPIARHSFDNSVGPGQKIESHRNFLAKLIKLIHENTEYNLLFLPHTIGPDKKMDDRIISKDVVKRANLNHSKRVVVFEKDLSAKELKGIIKKADFLIAERVHSIIGAIGVNTPFMCLASKADTRVEGILKQQMNQSQNIYYLNTPNANEAYNLFLELFAKRSDLKLDLQELNRKIQSDFDKIKTEIRDIIDNRVKITK